jgi:hypothetical protein
MIALFLLFATVAFADDASPDARPQYCGEPIFIIHGEPEAHDSPRDEEVLSTEENADPELAQSLAATPGPYGHSELGFRYLARLFGYPGKFTTREQVEKWLISQEAEKYSQKKGLWKIWEHWVVNSKKRLAVPRGAVSELPRNGDPDMFFLDARDRATHAHCVKLEIATQLCENYYSRRGLLELDVVFFPGSTKGAEKFGYCEVRVPPWRVAQETRRAAEWNVGVGRPEGAKIDSSGKSAK